MGKQETEFYDGEGDAWLIRNRAKVGSSDPVQSAIATLNITPKKVMEIGCSNGWRLAQINTKFPNALCFGIDPSSSAVAEGKKDYSLALAVGTANTSLKRMCGGRCDLVIYGFCLYLASRPSLFRIAMVGDDITANDGYIIIHDFDPGYPHKVPYHHVPGLFSYKMDYSKLWLANPAYSLVSKTVIGDGTAVWVLKKDIEAGWPLEERHET